MRRSELTPAGAIKGTTVRICGVQAASGPAGKQGRRVAIGKSSCAVCRNVSLARGFPSRASKVPARPIRAIAVLESACERDHKSDDQYGQTR